MQCSSDRSPHIETNAHKLTIVISKDPLRELFAIATVC